MREFDTRDPFDGGFENGDGKELGGGGVKKTIFIIHML